MSLHAVSLVQSGKDVVPIVQLSAVLQLLDGVTHQPALNAQPVFLLNGKPVPALAKANAFYVLKNLDPGQYQLQIVLREANYFAQSLSLQVPPAANLAESIVVVELQPSPLYPYPASATMIRGQVLTVPSQTPLAGVSIRATYQSARGKQRTAQTATADFGRYGGRFALLLAGNLNEMTAVQLVFEKKGYRSVSREVQVARAALACVNVEMQQT